MQSRYRPTPSMVVALIALASSLAGVGYAATRLPAASVGTVQLKNNSVSTPKIRNTSISTAKLRNNSVTTAKVRNGTLLASDFAPGQLRAGPPGTPGARGATGPTGPRGATGAPGAAGLSKLTYVEGAVTPNPAATQTTVAVTCPLGESPLSGGILAISPTNGDQALNSSYPDRSTGAGGRVDSWRVYVDNTSATASSFIPYAVCGQVTTASNNFTRTGR